MKTVVLRAFAVTLMSTIGCGSTCPERPASTPASAGKGPWASPRKTDALAPPQGTGPTLTLVPETTPAPALHVTLETGANGWTVFGIAEAPPDRVSAVQASDDGGKLGVTVEAGATEGSVRLRLASSPRGRLRLSYRVLASKDPMATLPTLVVADDRFRALGKSFVPVPEGAEDSPFEATVTIVAKAIAATHSMSSLGLGETRSHRATFQGLAHGMYLAGSLGTAVMVEPAGERDEVAWLGYTSFDPRPAAAEIAQIRTALRETWKGGGEDLFSVAFVSTTRPAGSFTVASLAGSAVVHLGPSEPWSAAMRVSVTQSLARPWFGGELRIATREGHEAEGTWFSEGVARFASVRLLARLGLLSPNDVAEWVNALLAAQALSPYRSKARVEVADKAKDDPRARGQLGVLGALHAVRVWTSYAHMPATLPFANAETNERTLDTELIALIRAGRKGPRRALDESAWVAILERTVGATEAKGFDATIVRGGDVVPPSSALGPCFRLNPTRAKDVDVGLDLGATVDGRTRALARLERGGVANRAGAKDGDVLVNFSRDATGHVRLVVARGEGSTKRDTTIDYEAATISAKASGFTPLRGKPDAECGSVL